MQPSYASNCEQGSINVSPLWESALSGGGRFHTFALARQTERLGHLGLVRLRVSVFGDAVIASAILDRLLHHSIMVNIKGEASD